jgi:hypothetical protein
VPSSARNDKVSMAKEGFGTFFGGQHCLSQILASVEFGKDMMEQNSPECPYEYMPCKEFLPDFALECNKRLLHMRVFQMWYLEAVELGLESAPVNYPANDIFAIGVKFSKLTISFKDIQFLYRQKRLDVSPNSSSILVLCACAILLTTHLPYFHVGKSRWIRPS